MKFLKNLLASFKEGIDQANAEEAKEEADSLLERNELRTAALEQQKVIFAKFALLCAEEKFYTALGAPYRETFIRDLSNADTQQRPAYFLYAMEIPNTDKSDIAHLIHRDFGVADRATLQKTAAKTELVVYLLAHPDLLGLLRRQLNVAEDIGADAGDAERLQHVVNQLHDVVKYDDPLLIQMLNTFRSETRNLGADFPEDKMPLLALWLSRLSYMTSASVALGYVTQPEALSMLSNIVTIGLVKIHSWKQFGELFVEGDRQDASNNVLGRKILARQVTRLLTEEQSPWVQLEWPINQLALKV